MYLKVFSARFFLFFCSVFLLACNPLKKIPEGYYFLDKNKFEQDSLNFSKEELNSLMKQKTNREILGILRLHLGIYYVGNTGDTTVAGHKWFSKAWKKIKRGMRQIGEEPVILDTFLTRKSREQLEIFLQRKGYFNAVVTDSTAIRKKKATVYYRLKPGRPYSIRTVQYSSSDKKIENILLNEKNTSVIESGKIYDEANLDRERDRLTSEIRDRGYYFFNRNYITYEVDSSLGSHEVDVYLYVNRLFENTEEEFIHEEPEDHHQYRLNNIYIYTNYDARKEGVEGDTAFLNDYYFISDLRSDYIKKEALLKYIFISKGDQFYQKDVDYTYTRLADLNIFAFINFRFREVERDSSQTEYLLDVILQLSPHAKQEYKIESEATNNGGNLGVAGSLSYENKNLLRGAESFEVKFRLGLEHQTFPNNSSANKKIFNVIEFGPELNLRFKRFLLPRFIEKGTSRRFNPLTTLSAGFNYQDYTDFERKILKFSFGYQWRISSTQRMQYYPFEINSVYVEFTNTDYEARIKSSGNTSLQYSYNTHLITSGRLSWTLSNQVNRPGKSFFFLRTNLETAGNTMHLYHSSFIKEQDSVNRNIIFKVPYYQYIKPELEFIYHLRLNQTNKVVYRLTGGVGFTYGNSENLSLPFDKAFFASGANDIRAWVARDLGPGKYEETIAEGQEKSNFIESAGDIKMEANVEYRATIFKIFETALFADAGNVWIRKDTSGTFSEQGKFEPGRFMDDIAVGAGIGFRFNFTFFIIRLDFAVKVRNPVPPNDNFFSVPGKYRLDEIVTNFAIGYPF